MHKVSYSFDYGGQYIFWAMAMEHACYTKGIGTERISMSDFYFHMPSLKNC